VSVIVDMKSVTGDVVYSRVVVVLMYVDAIAILDKRRIPPSTPYK
jgi:hypothetical protein